MREIKFRVWVVPKKDDDLPFIEPHPYMAVQGEPDIETLSSFMFHYADAENLMRYTGLPDREKKDIYEGDIVQLRYWHNNPPSKRPKQKFITVQLPVIFEDGQFKPDDQETRSTDYGTTYGNWWEHCAVIGNIFENPDLIKTK